MDDPSRAARAGPEPGRGLGRRAAAPATAAVELLSGPSLLDDLGAELDELHRATATPVTARRPWVRAWAGAYAPAGPWGVAVRDGASGRLDAVALFCHRDHGSWDEIAPLGRRQLDRGFLPARHPGAARALATAVSAHLRSRSRPWMLRIGQLPAGDPVARGIVDALPDARTVPGLPIPKVEFGGEETVEAWLGKGLRKQLRKARNRVGEDGVRLAVGFESEAGAVEEVLGEVERTHRAREQHARRSSDLDSRPGLRFWRDVVVDHARRGEVEVGTLRLDGDLAAYVVSLLDGGSYRVFDGRFATSWARFSPGRLLETAMLERALDDARFERVDWMNGLASEKLLAANAADRTEHLVAASPGLVVDLDVIGHAPVAVDHPQRADPRQRGAVSARGADAGRAGGAPR